MSVLFEPLRCGDEVAVMAPALFDRFGLRAHLLPGCFARHPAYGLRDDDDSPAHA